MWTVVADRHNRGRLLREMVLLSHAVWDPSKLVKLLKDPDPMTQNEVQEALSRAEKIMNQRTRPVTLEELHKRKLKLKEKDGRS